MPQIGEEHDNHADERDEFEDGECDGAGAWWHGGCVWAGVGGAGYMCMFREDDFKADVEAVSEVDFNQTRLVGGFAVV